MNSVLSSLREARQRLGLTQGALAHAAGVSLATVQNVEVGRANPALRTLERILSPLGLEIVARSAPADWAALIALGLPLSGVARPGVRRDAETLVLHVVRAADELERAPDAPGVPRCRDALQALVLAAHLHFPDALRGRKERLPRVAALLARPRTGRIVKLTRIAVARLAEYL